MHGHAHGHSKHVPFLGVFFYGKKDKTNVSVRNEETTNYHLRSKTEEHYAIVLQPNNLFYTHVTPTSGTAKNIAESICEKLEADEIDLSKLLFIGCDGTNTNTSYKNGTTYNRKKSF